MVENRSMRIQKDIDYENLRFSGNLKDIYSEIPLCEGTRMIWMLIHLFMEQRTSKSLVILPRRELAKDIEERLKTIMTSDIQRHDFEDQLERKGYIGRKGTEKDVKYFITPSGIFRAYYYLSKIEEFDKAFNINSIVNLMYSQGEMISKDLGWL